MSTSRSRRSFLQSAAALTAGAAIGQPFFVHAGNKSGSKKPVIGEGELIFEADHHWGATPDSLAWGATHGICFDAEGLVYITHQSNAKTPCDAIAVFKPDGEFVRSFGKEFHGGGHGLDIRSEGGEQFLYLSDIKHDLIVKLTLKGEEVWRIEIPTESGVYEDNPKYTPTNVAFLPDGGFVVGDGYGSSYLHIYDGDANYVKTFAGPGNELGKCKTPHGLWWDDRPGREAALAVADRSNGRIEYFTAGGEAIDEVPCTPRPCDFDTHGEYAVVPDMWARLVFLNGKNETVCAIGGEQNWIDQVLADKLAMRRNPDRWPAGRFIHPHDAAFDADGNVYVVEWVATGRITKLRRV
ncbi:twin-arginine translocation signal domain-containing protein [Stratiformator vulcanicus]|uniref:NHL repeat protein n=1 Tax=Stratiformator vulcanicus TaxID=2527980 RepID=A0A517R1Q5_9PLAN|nr:twin-arginine translocation signal domain-containing protein [Stratiformator vulcanicus]QDT37806.1 NHL repeat protein [Stratiformator vulcanicus]